MPELPFETPRTSAEKAVLELLEQNGRAWHVRDIVEALGMNERLVRKCVANLVELGEPILSGNEGYFFPRTAEDVERACEGYMKRVLPLLRRIKRLKENTTYKELLGEIQLALACPRCGEYADTIRKRECCHEVMCDNCAPEHAWTDESEDEEVEEK